MTKHRNGEAVGRASVGAAEEQVQYVERHSEVQTLFRSFDDEREVERPGEEEECACVKDWKIESRW